jgi:MarR family transcriptional repressor of emrRAB
VLYGNADKGMRPTELSVFMDSSRTNVTRLADELAEKGWVERASDPEDRRQIMLTLTKQGAALVEDTIPQVRDQQQALWASFTKDERQTLDRLLRKLLEQLD